MQETAISVQLAPGMRATRAKEARNGQGQRWRVWRAEYPSSMVVACDEVVHLWDQHNLCQKRNPHPKHRTQHPAPRTPHREIKCKTPRMWDTRS
eukprot:1299858-Rhodomonas_salina.1